MRSSLRPHQTRLIEGVTASRRAGNRRIMAQLPTGGGKTITAATLAERALSKGKRVAFTVPRLSLVEQTLERWWAEGLTDIGVIQGRHTLTALHRPLQIASVQTLARREVEPFDLVIVDEAHERSRHLSGLMRALEWAGTTWVGLSATPWSKGLGEDWDDLVIGGTTAELIAAGYLSPFKAFAPSQPDLTGVKTVAGDYHEGQLSEAMSRPELVGCAVSTWLQHGAPAGTLVFGVDRAHARHLRDQFEAAGVRCGYVDADTPMDERVEMGKAFDAKALPVIANCECMTTGVDLDVRCLVICRPTKSEMKWVQIVGRGLRTAPGKAECLILDHADNHARLGFVTDIHHEHLDDGSRKEAKVSRSERDEPQPKPCPSCSYLKPPRVHACPSCGFEPQVQTDVVHRDGELVELDAAGQRKANREATWDDKTHFVAQLRLIAQRRGRSEGWVAHKYRERFGVFPNDPRVRYADPAGDVDPAVAAWVRSRDIAFAKRKQREAA